VRGALPAVLEGEGHTVLEARHGEEALRMLRAPNAVCLILLDAAAARAGAADVAA